MVAVHGEFGVFLLDCEVIEVRLCREFIAESYAIVVYAEAHHNVAVEGRLRERHGQLVVVVADFALLAPYGFPGFVEARRFPAGEFEAFGELQSVGCCLLSGLSEVVAGRFGVEGKAQTRRGDNLFAVEVDAVRWHAPFEHIEVEHNFAVGAGAGEILPGGG